MLSSLSPELLHLVCSYFDRASDTCNFRLACNACAAAGLRCLFPRITTILLPRSVERLAKIADHHVLRHHVKELVLITSKLLQCDSSEEFATHLPVRAMLGWAVNPSEPHATIADEIAWERHQWPESKVAEAWRSYKGLWQEQQHQDQETSSNGLADLKRAIAKLPRLRSIQIRHIEADDEQAPLLLPRSDNSRLLINLLATTLSSRDSYLEAALVTILLAETPIEVLSVVGLDARLLLREHPLFDHLKQGIKQLRRLSLQIAVEDESEPASWDQCRRDLQRGGLPWILSSITQIESVEIQAPYASVEEPVASFPRLFSNIAWAYLAHLHLAGFEVILEPLIAFIETHTQTLKYLQMRDLKLTRRNIHGWYDFFTSIAALLHLKDARFSGHFTADLSGGVDGDYINMTDEVQGVPITVSDALRALLCRSYFGVEHDMLRETMDDLLNHQKKRLAPPLRLEIPVRHAGFLRSIC